MALRADWQLLPVCLLRSFREFGEMDMKRFFGIGLAATALSLPTLAAAQEAVSMDQRVNDIFAGSTGWFVNLIFMSLPGTNFPWIVLWLVVAASVFTIYFGFIQFKAFGHAISLVKGDYSDPDDAGETA